MKKNTLQKTLTGTVVSTKQQKTVVVEVVRKVAHPLYKKILTVSKKYQVDCGAFTPKVGDKVAIIATRPISKNKFFKILEVEK